MNKKIKVHIAVGGTGGHVFPGYHLAKHLINQNYDVELIIDKRGQKYLEKSSGIKMVILPSSPITNKNFFKIFISSILIFFSILRSTIFLLFNRPSLIIGMGGYASFPMCVAASILKIKFFIYENNLVIGKANKYLLPLADKIFVANKELEGIPKKYSYKIIEIGNIIKKEILNSSDTNVDSKNYKKINILVIGGSQAAKIFAEKLPNIFKTCSSRGVPLKIFQHCLPKQNYELKIFYEKNNIEFETFNFTNQLEQYFSRVNLAITRSGSSILAELTNAKIPIISVPLPSSADNHQLKNANFYQSKGLAFLIEEKDLNSKLSDLILNIYENKDILKKIIDDQRQYSDKNVYNNINQLLKKIFNEKN